MLIRFLIEASKNCVEFGRTGIVYRLLCENLKYDDISYLKIPSIYVKKILKIGAENLKYPYLEDNRYMGTI